MAADDPSDATSVTHDSATRDIAPSDGTIALTNTVSEWLFARTSAATNDVTVAVSVHGGRWVVRVESGNVASSIDAPARGEHSASEVAAAVRRWARGAGLSSRIDGQHAGEARVTITPVAATRS